MRLYVAAMAYSRRAPGADRAAAGVCLISSGCCCPYDGPATVPQTRRCVGDSPRAKTIN